MLADYQAYSSMFKSRLEPIIQQEWQAQILAERLTDDDKAKRIPPVPLNFRNKTLRRLLAEEPQEIREEVDTWRRAQRKNEVKVEIEDEEAQRLAAAAQYHK